MIVGVPSTVACPVFGTLGLILAMLFSTTEATCLLTNEQGLRYLFSDNMTSGISPFLSIDDYLCELTATLASYIQLDHQTSPKSLKRK